MLPIFVSLNPSFSGIWSLTTSKNERKQRTPKVVLILLLVEYGL